MRQVPPPGKGSLYIRPLLMGSGPVLGLGPAPECTFLIYAIPVGNYFKVGLVFCQIPILGKKNLQALLSHFVGGFVTIEPIY